MELRQQIEHDDYRIDEDAVAEAIVARLVRRAAQVRLNSEAVLEAGDMLAGQAVEPQA